MHTFHTVLRVKISLSAPAGIVAISVYISKWMKTKYYHSTHGVITSHVDRDLLTAYRWSFSGREVDWLLFNDCDADFAEAFPLHIHKALLSEKDDGGEGEVRSF